MKDWITVALAALAVFTVGVAAGAAMVQVVGPEPGFVSDTNPPATATATVREPERASRSHSRGAAPRPSSTRTMSEGSRAGVPVESSRVSVYTMTMDPALNARLWELIADCESSGNWHATGGSFSGGLQFLPSTWAANGGLIYAPTAAQASKPEQIAVANRLSSGGDWLQPWPVCGKRAASELGMRFP